MRHIPVEVLTALTTIQSQTWREDALCREVDPDTWFPEKGGTTKPAKRICVRCEVQTECREYALGANERFGVFGGLSESERRKLLGRAPVGGAA